MNKIKIDFKTLHLQSKGIQLFFALLIAIGVNILSYVVVFQGQIDEYQMAKETEMQLKEEFEQKSVSVANLTNLKEEVALLKENINYLLKQLPTDAQIPSLIQEMHQAAAKNGLTMNHVTPQSPINYEQVQRLPFEISLTGSHDQIIDFTRDVGRMSRIVTLSDMVLSNADSKDLNGNKLTFTALANTYKALDASTPAAGNTEAANEQAD